MLGPFAKPLAFVTFSVFLLLHASAAQAQISSAEFQRILSEKMAFEQADFAALQQGETVAKLLKARDKREVGVSGIVGLQVPADVFLDSFRRRMLQKRNPAILEIGSFSNQPTLEDLRALTFETRDIEDLKTCVVGDCQLKLSAKMIERLQREVDWQGTDYAAQATQLLKSMLLDYVRDYLARGDAALIEYADKEKPVWLAHEQKALSATSSLISDFLGKVSASGFAKSEFTNLESLIVWSKFKFGLKPVFTIEHIIISRSQAEDGTQILIESKQIYANHYFDSSRAQTAFLSSAGSGSYLLYENRSRVDGLGGIFGKIKRSVVEDRAVDGLKAILEQSKASFNPSVSAGGESTALRDTGRNRWRLISGRRLAWLLLFSAFAALLILSTYYWRSVVNANAGMTMQD